MAFAVRRHRARRVENPREVKPGHPGRTLEQVADPDEITVHRGTTCSGCGASLRDFRDRIILPGEVAVREGSRRAKYPVREIPQDAPVLDLGIDTIQAFGEIIRDSGTVVLNGPDGVFEDPDFATGTYEIVKAASQAEFSVVGGGHTAAVIEKLGLGPDFTHLSTGGGACIEFLTGKVSRPWKPSRTQRPCLGKYPCPPKTFFASSHDTKDI